MTSIRRETNYEEAGGPDWESQGPKVYDVRELDGYELIRRGPHGFDVPVWHEDAQAFLVSLIECGEITPAWDTVPEVGDDDGQPV